MDVGYLIVGQERLETTQTEHEIDGLINDFFTCIFGFRRTPTRRIVITQKMLLSDSSRKFFLLVETCSRKIRVVSHHSVVRQCIGDESHQLTPGAHSVTPTTLTRAT